LVIRSCRSRAAAIASASGGTIAASTSASWSTGSSPGIARRPNSSACTAHDNGRRRAQPAVASSGSGRELVHVADAQIGDDLDVRGQPELGGELALVEEAHPADPQALGPGGQPQVRHREHAGEVRGPRLGGPAQRVPAAAGPVAADRDVDRRVQDGLDLQPVERAGPGAGQVRGERVPVPSGQRRDSAPAGPGR
jgi:hypothetical protein